MTPRLNFSPILVVTALALFAGVGLPVCAAVAAGVADLPAGVHRVVFLGDSITYGGDYAVDIETYFRTRHPDRDLEFINVGLRSETVSGLSEEGHAGGKFRRPDLHERLDRVLAALQPDLVFACYGMNDGIYLPFDEARFRAYRDGLVWLDAAVRAVGAKIIFLTPPPYDGRARGQAYYEDVLLRYCAWLLDQRATRGWDVIDIHTLLAERLAAGVAADPHFTLTRDGVHPGELGHWLIAREVLQHLGARDLGGIEDAATMAAVHPVGREILPLIRRRSFLMRDAWLTAIGHQRPDKPGPPLDEAQPQAEALGRRIAALLSGESGIAVAPDDLRFGDRLQPVEPTSFYRTEGYYNWGGSILRDATGTYHLFYSRWRKELSFNAWLTESEIAHATADRATGPWTYRATVLRGRGDGHWDAVTAHNPKIKAFNGKFYLYHISTNWGNAPHTPEDLREAGLTRDERWWLLRGNQRTGVAVADSLDGPWTRADAPLLEPTSPIADIVVNPAIARGDDGRYRFVIKGDKPGTARPRLVRNQALALGDSPTGPFVIQPEPVIDDLDTEDMSIWFDGGRHRYYGVFHAVGRPPKAFIGMVTSADGQRWEKAAEYRLTPKTIRLRDGSLFVPDRMERPFVYCEGDEPVVMSVAVKTGDDSFIVCLPVAPE